MGRAVLINGVAVSPEEAVVPVYDRGFLYGDSVFETIRTYAGVLFALAEHMGRLARSAELIGIPLPVDEQQLAEETTRAVELAGNEESYARVMLTRGSGPIGLDPALASGPRRVVLVEPLTRPPQPHYDDGIRIRCVQTVRASDAAHSAKLGNYLASALALRDARAAGAHEALVVNRDGLVVEGTTSNVFCVRGGAVYTPPVDIGILAGITRALVIDLVTRNGLEIRYAAFCPQELAASDEVFITSSIREILPVVHVDDLVVGAGKPGPLTQRIHQLFRAHVGL